ncbi:MAG: phosphoglycerate kinase [Oscillospiraceae bacterium]|nr:phosphoglycerate kinase [Oscillospiraceae bacterium]
MGKLNKKSVDDLNLCSKRVLVRCDFNVPLKEGEITDDGRIKAALPTIRKLISEHAQVVLCSHLGKPKNGPEDKFSLKPVADRLTKLLEKQVTFAKDDAVVGPNSLRVIEAMKDGDVVLLENTRFRSEETKNDDAFSKELASIADIYVNDAFGSAHRAHCSTAGVVKFVEESAVGYLINKEIEFLGNAIEEPERPFVAILGGAKVADKLNVISNLLDKCDTLIIGGGMAYTFIKAQGGDIGNSLVDNEKLDYCNEMLSKAKSLGKTILLPVDSVNSPSFPNPIDGGIQIEITAANQLSAGTLGLDIGPESQKIFAAAVSNAKTVVWNGPMGVFENPTLAKGTIAVAAALAQTNATTIIGGGDSAAAIVQLGFADKVTHISTGGGASLEYLEGKTLPGIDVLDDN